MTKHRIGLSDNWLRHVQDVAAKHEVDLDKVVGQSLRHRRLCELNVREQVLNIAQCTAVQEAWERGQPLEEEAFGIRIRRIPGVRRRFHRALDLGSGMIGTHPPYFMRTSYFQEYARAIAKWLRSDPPDCVHVQVASQFLPAFRSAAPAARIVLHMHDELLTRAGRNLVGARISRADAVVTCSDYITSRWQQTFEPFASRIFTVRNGVDLQRFSAPAAGERAGAKSSLPREVLFVGRVSPEKGAHVLASAFEIVCAELPDTRLTFVGPAGLLPYSFLRLLSDDMNVASLDRFYGTTLIEQARRQVIKPKQSYIDSFMGGLSKRAASNDRPAACATHSVCSTRQVPKNKCQIPSELTRRGRSALGCGTESCKLASGRCEVACGRC
jgi:glycosyltransferase involved in cell wall biosynthesis